MVSTSRNKIGFFLRFPLAEKKSLNKRILFKEQCNMHLPGALSVPCSEKKKIHPEKKSFYLRKLNFITIRLKKFLYFLKRQLFLYFRKGTLHFLSSGLKKKSTLEKFFICFQKKAFLIFRELELYCISRKGNPEKNPYISGNETFFIFWKTKPPKKSLYFRKRNFLIFS